MRFNRLFVRFSSLWDNFAQPHPVEFLLCVTSRLCAFLYLLDASISWLKRISGRWKQDRVLGLLWLPFSLVYRLWTYFQNFKARQKSESCPLCYFSTEKPGRIFWKYAQKGRCLYSNQGHISSFLIKKELKILRASDANFCNISFVG